MTFRYVKELERVIVASIILLLFCYSLGRRKKVKSMNGKYFTKIEDIEFLSNTEKEQLQEVTEKFAFGANNYFLSLINWSDPKDPIRRLIIPDGQELEKWGCLDASDEHNYTVIPGVQHKYTSTALFLVSNACGGICRYCFRKRIFMREETLQDLDTALEYVRKHKEITNVLLTGGDPLMLATQGIERIVRGLRDIDHVQIIRIGTKIPSYNPWRIIKDPSLLNMLARYSTKDKRIYVITHFDHPRELTDSAVKAAQLMHSTGAVLANQTPLIRGINDNEKTLAALLNKLSFIGVAPYYVFQCRPVSGNMAYAVPIEEGYEIFEKAKSKVSGLAKRARYVMSHSTGKMEVVGKTDSHLYLKYQRAVEDANNGRLIALESNPSGYWFDDYNDCTSRK